MAGLIALAVAVAAPRQADGAAAQPFLASPASPEVRTVIQLGSSDLHPRQLAYDPGRDGLWFWTSRQQRGTTFDNQVYFYDIPAQQLRSWPIYSGDWSAQVLSGLAVAPDGDVWIGWNRNLVDFHPTDGTFARYELPAQPAYPLPPAVLGDLPADLGVADLAVARDGTVWIARYAALSLTAFTPSDHTFHEHPLPANAGDPAKLAIGPDGHIFFTTNLSADHPGYMAEKVGEFEPRTGKTRINAQGALALAVTAGGDLYTALGGQGFGLARASAAERASAVAQQRAPVFSQRVIPADVDDEAIAADAHGRVWVAAAGQPQILVFDPAANQVAHYQYAAPSVAAHPPPHHVGEPEGTTPVAGAVWTPHIVAMATDGQAHLWYIRAGSDRIEEITA